MARHQDEYPVRLMCRVLAVSPAGFYAWRKRGPSPRASADERLRREVREAHRQSRRTYGAPRVHQELRAQGTRVARKRVARLMREEGLSARRPRRRVCTTDSSHTEPVAPNRLARRFAVRDIQGVDRVWASDITYVPTREGWLYLAVVLDLGSRRVVGWAMRETMETELAVAALQAALADRQPMGGELVHHADRGSQYASQAYRTLLAAHRVTESMSRKGNCWDNAVAESFFATLEHELLATSDFRSRQVARQAIFEFIEVWYNRQRRHSSLGDLSPAEYEQRLRAA